MATEHPAPAHHRDLVVIGAGPAGLYSAYYAGFRGLSVAIVDSLTEIGGQIATLFPEKAIFDVAGFPSTTGRDLVRRLQEQASSSDPLYLLGRTATRLIDNGGADLHILLNDGTAIAAKAVLVCAGVGRFEPRRLPVAEGWQGRGMEYFVTNTASYNGRDVIITGGGDSAVDWALHLEPVAKSVTLVHRRARFRAHESSVGRLLNSTVHVRTNAQISDVFGSARIDSVAITTTDGHTDRIPAQALVCALGFVADLGPLAEWGIEIQNRRIPVSPAMQTNVPRVFAAGDVSEYPGKVRLISVGFGEAAIAVNHIAAMIHPNSEVTPGHSSDLGAPIAA
ncbi:NAD(P)/FAD-dependent oxidoreductase [Naumannella halotolerans]|uniref:Ferredoxin--NADP reductase n=1 Tax=Naumannella halotolerans TaxID=993414 RepID=A0A4R7J190_9ACTN|nr:NAD(P)/FAD-dependent oxidoreductase [Naumannella halotolerans]TDT30087.1 thioredoxin reductase (NADPH) [Naumannella halotolerans]